jgi:hypothetical protein
MGSIASAERCKFPLWSIRGVDLNPRQMISIPLEDHTAAILSGEHCLDQPLRPGRQMCEGVIHLSAAERSTGAEVETGVLNILEPYREQRFGVDVERPIGRYRQRPIVHTPRSGHQVGMY